MIGNATAEAGELAAARPLMEQNIRKFEELGDDHYALIASYNLAWVVGDLGDVARQRELLAGVLEQARVAGEPRIAAGALAELALHARDDGRLDDAESMLREAIRIEHERGEILPVAIDLGRLASVVARAGRDVTAARLLAASEALMEALGVRVPVWADKRNDETRAAIHELLDDDAFARATEEGRALNVNDAVVLALSDAE